MSKNISINKDTQIDLQKLVKSRLLIQANSGGGKSWLLRRLLEQSHGKVQQIVLDLEGEFSTLREKHDYILVAKGGDAEVSLKSAAMLAERLLELNVSAIIDLYELPAQDRKRFVKLFLDAMVNAPKNLWHPCLVVIDEAHVFAPEKGESEALGSVLDLCTRGRKRGYCAVLATQRLSKLHKDAAAECNNKLIGRTGLDIDRKRAAEELGFTTKEQNISLRDLEAGEFYAFGTAISKEVKKVRVGEVYTTHPEAGTVFKAKVAPPSAKIKAALGKLSDLPEEAKKQAETVAELKAELAAVRRHKCPEVKEVVPAAMGVSQWREYGKERGYWEYFQKQVDAEWEKKMREFVAFTRKLKTQIAALSGLEIPEFVSDGGVVDLTIKKHPNITSNRLMEHPQVKAPKLDASVARSIADFSDPQEVRLTGGAMRMAKVLASRYPMKMSRTQLATFSKMKPSSGTYGTYLSTLKTGGYFNEENGLLVASEKCVEEHGGETFTSEGVIEMWKGVLSGGAKRMFEVLVEEYPNALTKDQLAEMTSMVASSGTFGTYLSTLRSNALIEDIGGGTFKIKDEIYQ